MSFERAIDGDDRRKWNFISYGLFLNELPDSETHNELKIPKKNVGGRWLC